MLILIYPKVFNVDSNIVMRHLDRLLLLFESGKHEWFLKVDTDTLMSWRWPKQLSLRHQTILKEIAEKSFVKTSQISIKEKRARGIVEVDFDSEQSIENWINLLEEPLFIVVENETSDKTFLNRLFQIYGEPGKMLMKALNKSHLTFYPAGGRNETIKTLNNIKAKSLGDFAPRIFLFIDSDKHFPEQQHSDDLNLIIEYCSKNNVHCHITYKREIENYIPREVLESKIPEFLFETLSEFFCLSPNQWDFFDLEKGFNNKLQEENGLYGEYSERKNERWQKLNKGFSHKEFNPKKELYLFFNDNNFNAANVQLRCQHQPNSDELLNLVINLNNLL